MVPTTAKTIATIGSSIQMRLRLFVRPGGPSAVATVFIVDFLRDIELYGVRRIARRSSGLGLPAQQTSACCSCLAGHTGPVRTSGWVDDRLRSGESGAKGESVEAI